MIRILLLSVVLFGLIVEASAEIVSFSKPGDGIDYTPVHGDLFVGAIGAEGRLDSYPDGFSVELNTTTGQGTITDAKFRQKIFGSTVERTFTKSTGVFPNITTVTTKFTEMVTFDPFTANPQYASATTTPIGYRGRNWPIWPTVTVAFPDSFTVTGNYKIQGPTQSFETPFSIFYQREDPSTATLFGQVAIRVGDDFPATASLRASGRVSRKYNPTTPEIFNGMLDGYQLKAKFTPTILHAWMSLPVPEPASWVLLVCGLVAIGRRRR